MIRAVLLLARKSAGDQDEKGSFGDGFRFSPRRRRVFRCGRGPLFVDRPSLVVRTSPAALRPAPGLSLVCRRIWLSLPLLIRVELSVLRDCLRIGLFRFELRAAAKQRRRL